MQTESSLKNLFVFFEFIWITKSLHLVVAVVNTRLREYFFTLD